MLIFDNKILFILFLKISFHSSTCCQILILIHSHTILIEIFIVCNTFINLSVYLLFRILPHYRLMNSQCFYSVNLTGLPRQPRGFGKGWPLSSTMASGKRLLQDYVQFANEEYVVDITPKLLTFYDILSKCVQKVSLEENDISVMSFLHLWEKVDVVKILSAKVEHSASTQQGMLKCTEKQQLSLPHHLPVLPCHWSSLRLGTWRGATHWLLPSEETFIKLASQSENGSPRSPSSWNLGK